MADPTPPYAPLSAPSASSQALPADQDTPRPYLNFDGMCWPNPDDPHETAWKLTHGQPSKEDLIRAGAFIGAYQQLVADSQRVRNGKISRLRRAMKEARRA